MPNSIVCNPPLAIIFSSSMVKEWTSAWIPQFNFMPFS